MKLEIKRRTKQNQVPVVRRMLPNGTERPRHYYYLTGTSDDCAKYARALRHHATVVYAEDRDYARWLRVIAAAISEIVDQVG